MWYQLGMNRTGLYRQLAEDRGEETRGYISTIVVIGTGGHMTQFDDWAYLGAVAAAHFARLVLQQTEHAIVGIEAWDQLAINER